MTSNEKTLKILTRATASFGVAAQPYDEFRAACKSGWIKSIGYRQNSMTQRFKITPAGQAKLAELTT